MSARRWLGRLGLLAGGLLLGLLLGELAARLLDPHGAADLLFNAPDNAPRGMYRSHPDLVFEPVPGFEATARSLGYRVPVRFDAHGLRGPPPPPPSDTPRWLAGGDSFTLALQVSEEQTFAARLAELRGWEVLNAGVDGHSTWQPPLRYAALDPELDLDGLLLVLFLGNDLDDNLLFAEKQQLARRRPAGETFEAPVRPPVAAWLGRHSYLFARWRVWQRARGLGDLPEAERARFRTELSLFTGSGREALAERLFETRRALMEAQRVVRERRDRLVVAVAPPSFVVDPERAGPTLRLMGLDPADAALGAPGEAVGALLDELGIPACDLEPELRSAPLPPEELYLPYDGHWSAAGHAVVADALDACMEAWGLPRGPVL